jgi:NAD(P)-dependent dehydrogenase (short-subunit alcohol dehydrogenase family)
MRILLTGASSGIGLLSARALCARGHEVWGTSRELSRLPTIEHFHPIALDLNDSESIRSAFGQAQAAAGHFDVLINNAGAGVFGPLEAFCERELQAQLQTLLLGPLQLIQMRSRNAGLIVNVSSLAGQLPLPFMAPYSLAKSALSAMTEGLTLELSHTAIRVVDVRPGDFATQFHVVTRRLESPLLDGYAPNIERAWRSIDQNMGRAPDPQKVANTLERIVSGRIRRPVVAVGDFFQARVAPYLSRRAARAWVHWGLRLYYGLKKSAG